MQGLSSALHRFPHRQVNHEKSALAQAGTVRRSSAAKQIYQLLHHFQSGREADLGWAVTFTI